MRWYRGPEGDQRIWYEADEIERIADDELRRAGLTPTPSAPVTDLERFIESHLGASLDQYADLPVGVLGMTKFGSGRRPAVSISSALTESAEGGQSRPGLAGRWRATLAHEAAHVLLHRYLFDPQINQLALFDGAITGETQNTGLMRCLKRDVGLASRTTDWREIQANRGMAALLMPRPTFRRVAFQHITAKSLTDLTAGSPSADTLATEMAAIFEVSRQAASIRLETINIVTPTDVLQLPGV
jgi:IrrE N-terminal-like domain